MTRHLKALLLIFFIGFVCIACPTICEAYEDDIFTGMNIRQDILDAIDASHGLSGGDFNRASDGGFFYTNHLRNYAYAYFNEKTSGFFADPANDYVLAIMEDGRVFNGTSLISGNARMWDIHWRTNRTNIDAYMLSRDGYVYYYDPYGDNVAKKVRESRTHFSTCAFRQLYSVFQ